MAQEHYRHRFTGIHGKIEITRDGDRVIRGDDGEISPVSDWVRELSWRPVQRSQLAIAAYAVDAAIAALFTHRKPGQWASLSESEKSGFIANGPAALRSSREHLKLRMKIFNFVMGLLDEANREESDDSQQNG